MVVGPGDCCRSPDDTGEAAAIGPGDWVDGWLALGDADGVGAAEGGAVGATVGAGVRLAVGRGVGPGVGLGVGGGVAATATTVIVPLIPESAWILQK